MRWETAQREPSLKDQDCVRDEERLKVTLECYGLPYSFCVQRQMGLGFRDERTKMRANRVSHI